MKEGLANQARWFLEATVGERMDAGVRSESLTSSLLVEMERLERVLPRYKAIVQDLAETGPVQQTGWDETFTACALCGASNAHEMDKPVQEMEGVRLADHAEHCPWRRAVEWTQQQ